MLLMISGSSWESRRAAGLNPDSPRPSVRRHRPVGIKPGHLSGGSPDVSSRNLIDRGRRESSLTYCPENFWIVLSMVHTSRATSPRRGGGPECRCLTRTGRILRRPVLEHGPSFFFSYAHPRAVGSSNSPCRVGWIPRTSWPKSGVAPAIDLAGPPPAAPAGPGTGFHRLPTSWNCGASCNASPASSWTGPASWTTWSS